MIGVREERGLHLMMHPWRGDISIPFSVTSEQISRSRNSKRWRELHVFTEHYVFCVSFATCFKTFMEVPLSCATYWLGDLNQCSWHLWASFPMRKMEQQCCVKMLSCEEISQKLMINCKVVISTSGMNVTLALIQLSLTFSSVSTPKLSGCIN